MCVVRAFDMIGPRSQLVLGKVYLAGSITQDPEEGFWCVEVYDLNTLDLLRNPCGYPLQFNPERFKLIDATHQPIIDHTKQV